MKIERATIIERGLAALNDSFKKATELQIQAMHAMLFHKHREAVSRGGTPATY